MPERSKGHAWKACVRYSRTEGSNPSLSATLRSSNFGRHARSEVELGVPATAGFLPAKLKSYVAVETKEKAMALEKYFKTGSG